ncbi:MAG: glycosyltransferase family 2 protein [Anaerolineaceae bacterium]|nr:glycosyltransferase family 2 protein [Anaerolineaceae bacterium]
MIEPLVSIITPSYNQENFLEETIKSVLNQDYGNFEYIIIDGNSDDNSVNIIKRYADKITYWVSEPDLGQSHAINKGFAIAKGEIVCWLNSDDQFFPQSISWAVNSMQNHPDVGMVYSNCLMIDNIGEVLAVSRSKQYTLVDLLSFNIIPQPTVFLRKDLIMKLDGLNQSLNLLFDHELWIRIASISPIYYENQLWAISRIHTQSKNSREWSGFGREANSIITNMFDDPKLSKTINSHSSQIQAGIACFSGNYALVNGDFFLALREFMKAILLQPRLIRRIWTQIIILPLLMTGIIHTGNQFYNIRRKFRFFTSSKKIR